MSGEGAVGGQLEGLSVIVPAYDEEDSLEEVVLELVEALEILERPFEILVVDDGSRDRTWAIASGLARRDERIRAFQHPVNLGSGAAIHTGMAEARLELVTYVPADGQFKIDNLADLLGAAPGNDVVLAYRTSRDDYTPLRILASHVFLMLHNWLFSQSFRDVNWVHLWRRESVTALPMRCEGVFLLGEILARGEERGFRVAEVPAQYCSRRGGRAKGTEPRVILETIREMFSIWWELRGRAAIKRAIGR